MKLLKKYLPSLLLALCVSVISPMASAVGKIENTSTEEVKQALDASVKATEDALATLKSGASEDIVNDHINNARQLIKRVEINRLDVIRTRSAENLKKARQAVSNGQKDQAEDFLATALKGFKEMQSAF